MTMWTVILQKKMYETAAEKNADIACCGFYRTGEKTGKAYSAERPVSIT